VWAVEVKPFGATPNKIRSRTPQWRRPETSSSGWSSSPWEDLRWAALIDRPGRRASQRSLVERWWRIASWAALGADDHVHRVFDVLRNAMHTPSLTSSRTLTNFNGFRKC